MNNIMQTVIKYSVSIKKSIHSNIYMIIGFYGVLAIFLLCCATKWLFNVELAAIFEPSLPPAWQANGDLNHILGTDRLGHDIFNYLLVSYKTTLILAFRVTFYVIIIGIIINYLLFFIPRLRAAVAIIFRLIIAIPPLLSTVVIALFWNNNINVILVIIAISYLPRFIHNIHHQIMDEWKKVYITAHRLDGLSTLKILNFYIVPNIFDIYLTEVVVLFSNTILALTILTFLGFGQNLGKPDLGIFMYKMLNIIESNFWAFFAPGLAIIMTILFIHMFNLGVNRILTKRIGH